MDERGRCQCEFRDNHNPIDGSPAFQAERMRKKGGAVGVGQGARQQGMRSEPEAARCPGRRGRETSGGGGVGPYDDEAGFRQSSSVCRHWSRIELHFLPTYSLELNAAEYVWKETGRITTHRRFFPTVDHLKEKPFRRFNRFQGNPASLRNAQPSFS